MQWHRRTLAALGIDRIGLAALVRAFLLIDLRGQHYARATASQPHFMISPLFWVIGQCLTLSAGLSLLLFARVDVYFFVLANLSVSLLVLAATLVVEFGEVVEGRTDLEVLGHRPIAPRTYAAARMINLLVYVGLMYAALNLFPLILGAGLRDAGVLYVPTYLLASLASSLAVTCLVIWLLAAAGDSPKLASAKEAFAWLQILLLLVVGYGAQLMFRDRTQAVLYWGAFPPAWVDYLPSSWLAQFVADSYDPDGRSGLIAAVLVVVAAASVVLGFARLVRLYRVMAPALIAAPVRTMPATHIGQVGGPMLTRWLPRCEERVGFWLCQKLLAREAAMKLRCLWPLNLAAAVVVLGLATGQFANPLHEDELRQTLLPALAAWLLAVSVAGIVYNLCFSVQHGAIWLLRSAPLADPAGIARGVCKAVMALIVVPCCLLLALLTGIVWQDPLAGALHGCLAFALSWPMALTALWLVVPDAPFSLSPVQGGSSGPLALPLAVLTGAIMVGAAMHALWAHSPWFWASAFAVALAAGVLVRRAADRRMARLLGSPA